MAAASTATVPALGQPMMLMALAKLRGLAVTTL
jgi:hypothetical protein